jgi:MFS family permease
MTTARAEWAAMWPLPLVSMLGYVGGASFAYSSGVFMQELTGEFGWSRAQFSAAFTIHSLVALVMAPFVGRLIDRIGPRKMALLGIVPFMCGLALFGLADGSIWQWWGIAFVQALLASMIGGAVWVKAVVTRFRASRGLALATVLAGSGVATTVWPVVAAFYISELGWRMSYSAMALSWGLLMLPLAWLFFTDADSGDTQAVAARKAIPLAELRNVYLSRSFISLALAGAIFSALTLGLLLHLVPIFQGAGLDLSSAAGIAGLTGVFAIVGRLSTGLLLDFLPTRPLAIAIFLLPLAISALLWNFDGSITIAVAAVMILGFVSGADGDIIAYLISKGFDPGVFATIYSLMVAILSVSSSVGPIMSGAIYDQWGSYDYYFLAMIPMALVAATLVGTMPMRREL